MDSRVEEQLSAPAKREWKRLKQLLEQAADQFKQEQQLLVAGFVNDLLHIERRKVGKGEQRSLWSLETFAKQDKARQSMCIAAVKPVVEADLGRGMSPASGPVTVREGWKSEKARTPDADAFRCVQTQRVQGALLEGLGGEFSEAEARMEQEWLCKLSKRAARVAQEDTGQAHEWLKVKFFALSDTELLLQPLRNLRDWIQGLQEPPRRGRLAGFVTSSLFETICCVIICAHCLTSGLIANESIAMVAEGMEPTPNTVVAVNSLFLLWYWVELCLRLLVHRFFFLVSADWGWNVFDTVLVLFSTAETIRYVSGARLASQFAFGRVSRFLKVVRVLRVLRVLRVAVTPRLMLDCLLQSIPQLLWACVLLAFILGVFSLLIVQALASFMAEEGRTADSELTAEMLAKFGSIETAAMSLFQAVGGGEPWAAQFRLVVRLGWGTSCFYVLFVVAFLVVFWNMFTGIVVTRIAELAAPDTEQAQASMQRRQLQVEEALLRAFSQVDKDWSGSISCAEFVEAMGDESFREAFSATGLDLEDIVFLFDVLSSHMNEDSLDIKDVVMGCMKLRGKPSCLDSVVVMQMVRRVQEDQRSFILFCMRRLQGITERLQVAEELVQRAPEAAQSVQQDIASFGLRT